MAPPSGDGDDDPIPQARPKPDIDPRLYDCDLLFPSDLSRYYAGESVKPETRRWLRVSAVTTSVVGAMSRIFLRRFNKAEFHNRDRLQKALHERSENVPLVTVTNHHCCMDEPLLWGILDYRDLCDNRLMRWALAAHDICFTNKLHANFFAYGKSIPLVRGDGVHQKGMDFCLDRLNDGQWVHLYPEGRVNVEKKDLRFKWGVGRLIAESNILPVVVPIYHLGMDSILPNRSPYIPHVRQRVTICVGEPIPLEETIEELRRRHASCEERRQVITDLVYFHMQKLKIEAEIFHAKHTYRY